MAGDSHVTVSNRSQQTRLYPAARQLQWLRHFLATRPLDPIHTGHSSATRQADFVGFHAMLWHGGRQVAVTSQLQLSYCATVATLVLVHRVPVEKLTYVEIRCPMKKYFTLRLQTADIPTFNETVHKISFSDWILWENSIPDQDVREIHLADQNVREISLWARRTLVISLTWIVIDISLWCETVGKFVFGPKMSDVSPTRKTSGIWR